MDKQYTIILGENRSKTSTNSDTNLTFDITDNRRVLPEDTIVGKVDEYEQYIKEKDACTKFNMIFTMNVVASNVLFNRVSEIVYHEGSDDCIFFGRNGASTKNLPDNINVYNTYKTNDNGEYLEETGRRGKNILASLTYMPISLYQGTSYNDTIYFAADSSVTIIDVYTEETKSIEITDVFGKYFNYKVKYQDNVNYPKIESILICGLKGTAFQYQAITFFINFRTVQETRGYITFKDTNGYKTAVYVVSDDDTTGRTIDGNIEFNRSHNGINVTGETSVSFKELYVDESGKTNSRSAAWATGDTVAGNSSTFTYHISKNKADDNNTGKQREGYFVFKNNNQEVGRLYVFQEADKDIRVSGELMMRYNLLRDTAYSHKDIGGVVYHCGYDIFGNHMLRKGVFNVINKLGEKETPDKKINFNTLSDYNRDYNGNIIKDNIATIIHGRNGAAGIGNRSNLRVNRETNNTHQYLYDSVLSMNDTIRERLVEKNGWFGFINPSGMDIKNYGDISINKCMNNNKACEQIDMYPDRSLFYVVPKYNKYRHRVENNWDYCITFPYKSLYDHELVTSNRIIVGEKYVNGLKCELVTRSATLLFSLTDERYEESALEYKDNVEIMFSSDVSHDLSVGDTIMMWVKYSGETYEITTDIVSVGVGGDYPNNFFTINSSEFANIFSEITNGIANPKQGIIDYGDYDEEYEYGFIKWDNEEDEIRIARVVRGKPCEYYIRLFKKLPNFKNTDAYADGIISDDEIQKYSSNDFNSSLNNLAFSNNIYGDPIGQIVFNDDIDINGLKDNLGRDVSELYLTVIKTNNGYKEWYDEKDYGSENVEFSHCFGKITAGFDFLPYSDDYNIHKLHNVNLDSFSGESFNEINKETVDGKEIQYDSSSIKSYYTGITNYADSPKSLEGPFDSENEITTSGDTFFGENNLFFGDVAEFSLYDVNETILENVNFRFNTVQREYTKDPEFYDFVYEDIIEDDYKLFDLEKKETNFSPFKTSAVTYNVFRTNKNLIYTRKNNTDVKKYLYNPRYPFNIAPEGYYYSPHIRIPVREYSEDIKQGTHTEIKFEPAEIKVSACDSIGRWVTMAWNDACTIGEGSEFNIITAKNYYMNVGDRVFLYEIGSDGKKTIWGRVISVSGRMYNHLTIRFDEDVVLYEEDNDIRKFKYKLFKYNIAKPSNAIEMNDGTGNYLWRPFLSESEMMRGNELYDRPFTNGKIYVHKFVDIFLRRQDPYNEYGLNCDDCSTKISDLTIYGEYKDVSMYESEEATQSKICASVVGDMFTDVASQLETRAKNKVSNFNIDKVINTYREKRKKAKEEAKAAAEATAQQGQG